MDGDLALSWGKEKISWTKFPNDLLLEKNPNFAKKF